MSEESKETVVTVSGAKIKEVLANPDKTFDTLREFCDDISTLTKSMANLYEQHPIEFGLLGVQVEVIVRAQGLGKELIHYEFGCRENAHKILSHPVSKEETDEKSTERRG